MVAKRAGVRLRDWLRTERRTQEWLGEQIGAHQTSISAWMRGRSCPIDEAVKIEKLTGIPVEDWTIPIEESGPSGSLTPTGTE